MATKNILHDLRNTLEGTEVAIYQLLCENLSNREISDQLDMPVPTVKWHLRNIYHKLGVESRGTGDTQSARRRAILYAGTRIEQVVSYADKNERVYNLKDLRAAAKKAGCSINQIENITSFLEME